MPLLSRDRRRMDTASGRLAACVVRVRALTQTRCVAESFSGRDCWRQALQRLPSRLRGVTLSASVRAARTASARNTHAHTLRSCRRRHCRVRGVLRAAARILSFTSSCGTASGADARGVRRRGARSLARRPKQAAADASSAASCNSVRALGARAHTALTVAPPAQAVHRLVFARCCARVEPGRASLSLSRGVPCAAAGRLCTRCSTGAARLYSAAAAAGASGKSSLRRSCCTRLGGVL